MNSRLELQTLSRQYCAEVWRAGQAGPNLTAHACSLLAAMRRHPEWAYLWGDGADFTGEIVTQEGVSPYFVITVEAAVDGLTARNGDKFARRTFHQLQTDGLSEADARVEVGRCLLAVLWEVGTSHTKPELATKRLHDVFRRIQAGESAADIWPDR